MCAVLYMVFGPGVDHPPPVIVPMVRMSSSMFLLPFFDETFTFAFPVPGFRRIQFGTA